jgi:NAD-dependent DNA ligase
LKKSTVSVNGKFSDEKVCFTGFRNKDLEKIIESEGGTMVSGVSKNTTLVVAMDPDTVSSKTTKARDLGIKMISKKELEAKIGGNIDASVAKARRKSDPASKFFKY